MQAISLAKLLKYVIISTMRDHSKKAHKEALLLERALNDIRKKQRSLGRYKLPQPIQKGWAQQLRLRDDVLRCSEAERYKAILQQVQNVRVRRTVEELHDPKLTPLGPAGIAEHRGHDLWPDWFLEKYFKLREVRSYRYYMGINVVYPKVWSVRRPHLFEAEIVPHFVTHLPIIDPALQSESARIRKKIEQRNYWPILNRLHGRSNHREHNGYYRGEPADKELLEEFHNEIRELLNE